MARAELTGLDEAQLAGRPKRADFYPRYASKIASYMSTSAAKAWA
jgi:hypothetical protein